MKYRTTPYVLIKDGKYYVFSSEKAACDFLGVSHCCVASAARHGGTYHGYKVIKGVSENDIYRNKRLRKIWESMHERCGYERHPHFKSYGGRGISVCDEWKEYIPFAKWAFRNGYDNTLTLDRIDFDGSYEPSNCRWATTREQANNKRTNRIVVYNEERYTVSELAELIGMNCTTLRERLNMGWSVSDAVERPIRKRTCGYRPSARMDGKDVEQS